MPCTLLFQPAGKRGISAKNASLLEAARVSGIELIHVCGGTGTCGHCRVRIVSGSVSEPTSLEKKHLTENDCSMGFRLACQTLIQSDTVVFLPPESLTTPQRMQMETLGHALEVHNRFSAGPASKSPPLGLAVDLGTTKIAAYLMDLHAGNTLACEAVPNPQIAQGEDVVSRLFFIKQDPLRSRTLQEGVIHALNRMAEKMVAGLGESPDQIQEIVVAGNTAMHHLFLNLPLEGLSRAPYSPALTASTCLPAKDLGITAAPDALVYLPPNKAGFVGGDHLSALLSTLDPRPEKIKLLIDIGTNTEVCLAGPDFMTSVSCASGPAFEGAHIRWGMRAAEGAIEHLQLAGQDIFFQTIGNKPPVGLCGSGILDGVSELLKNRVIDPTGAFLDHPRVGTVHGQKQFRIQGDLAITQKDIREVQLAKAAIQTGISVLLLHHNLRVQDTEEVIVAGAFGNYLGLESAIFIGLLPDLPRDRFVQVGNAAGLGAKILLLSLPKRRTLETLADHLKYLELASHPAFKCLFLQNLSLEPLNVFKENPGEKST